MNNLNYFIKKISKQCQSIGLVLVCLAICFFGNTNTAYANNFTNNQTLNVTVYPGSLKSNIQRILQAAGWQQLVWSVPYDYNWVGQTTISGDSVKSVLVKILANYPLQAVFYQGNHVVLIQTR